MQSMFNRVELQIQKPLSFWLTNFYTWQIPQKHPVQDFRDFEENFTLVDGIRFSEKILRFYLKLKTHCA